MNIKELKSGGVQWIDVSRYSDADISVMRKKYKLHPFTVRELTSDSERSKVDKHGEYVFITHLYPFIDEKNHKIRHTEVNIMVDQDRIITFHQNKIPVLSTLHASCKRSKKTRAATFSSRPVLLYEILSRFLDYSHPMLDTMGKEISQIESELMDGREKEVLEDIMHLRRNITDFRRIMQGHKNTMRRFKTVAADIDPKANEEMNYFVNDLITHTKEIWERLEGYKEGVETLQQTNESLVTFRINSVMKVLAVMTSLMLPITIITGLFGVNAVNIPFIGQPYDFAIILAISFGSMLSLLMIFWYKNWLN